MSGVPGEELSSISGEERLGNLMQLIEAQRSEGWESRLHDILDSFEDFLTLRPEPPQAWKDTYAASGKQFDYYQIVLPKDFEDPYEDDLGNIRRLRGEFEREPSTMEILTVPPLAAITPKIESREVNVLLPMMPPTMLTVPLSDTNMPLQ